MENEFLSLSFTGRFWEVLSRERTRIANSLAACVSKTIAISTLLSTPTTARGLASGSGNSLLERTF
jgi:hypothetical protein